MSDATPEEDKARELEEMYDFFHGTDVTPDNVVARAIKELQRYVILGTYSTDQIEMEARNHPNDEMWKSDLEFSRYQLRLAKTHLDEFEEHKQIAHYRENGVSGCAVCDVDYDHCDFAKLKAKRLLGEEM